MIHRVKATFVPGFANRLRGGLTTALALGVLAASTGGGPARGDPQLLTVAISGPDAEIRLPASEAPCSQGGSGSYHHYVEHAVEGGILSAQPGTLRMNLDAHSDGQPSAFLQGDGSHITFTNQRGSVGLALSAGTCSSPALSFDGRVISGSGTWAIDPAYTRDAYREATGSGTFSFTASFAEGDANPWSLRLDGRIEVLRPSLQVEMVRSYWGNLGADYAGRVATVVYRLTNTGPGDAFGASFLAPSAPQGVIPIEFLPTDLDNLEVGESVDVTVRYRIGLRGPGGRPGLTGREFDTTVHAVLPDALDVARTHSVPVHVVAPAFPPAL